jgi:hypothetical protein
VEVVVYRGLSSNPDLNILNTPQQLSLNISQKHKQNYPVDMVPVGVLMPDENFHGFVFRLRL